MLDAAFAGVPNARKRSTRMVFLSVALRLEYKRCVSRGHLRYESFTAVGQKEAPKTQSDIAAVVRADCLAFRDVF